MRNSMLADITFISSVVEELSTFPCEIFDNASVD